MARVYLARAVHAPGERMVALKVIAAGSTREQQVMFRHEAQVSASLRHPNIVEVVDVGVSDDGASYLVMELVHGATLREVLAEAAKQGRVIPIGFGVAVAIAAAA